MIGRPDRWAGLIPCHSSRPLPSLLPSRPLIGGGSRLTHTNRPPTFRRDSAVRKFVSGRLHASAQPHGPPATQNVIPRAAASAGGDAPPSLRFEARPRPSGAMLAPNLAARVHSPSPWKGVCHVEASPNRRRSVSRPSPASPRRPPSCRTPSSSSGTTAIELLPARCHQRSPAGRRLHGATGEAGYPILWQNGVTTRLPIRRRASVGRPGRHQCLRGHRRHRGAARTSSSRRGR